MPTVMSDKMQELAVDRIKKHIGAIQAEYNAYQRDADEKKKAYEKFQALANEAYAELLFLQEALDALPR